MALGNSRCFLTITTLITSLFLFAHLAEDVITRDKLTLLDEEVVLAVNKLASPSMTQAVLLITHFGGLEIILVISLVINASLVLKGHWKDASLILGATLGGTGLMMALKGFFQRSRPVLGAPILSETGYSFPSGHSTVSMCFYGVLIYLVLRHCKEPWARFILCFVLASLIVLIGLSRVYLGVHYPSDVIAGFCIGIAWLSLCCCVYLKATKVRPESRS